MPDPAVVAYQAALSAALALRIHGHPVQTEWRAFDAGFRFYGPRLDIAVGPFAVGALRLREAHDGLIQPNRAFLELLWEAHVGNLGEAGADLNAEDFRRATTINHNARCFMAIEIENRGSRKHLMGSALNAAALGRIAVAVGWTAEKMRAFARLRGYLAYLREVDKPSFDVSNLLVVRREQLLEAAQG